MKLAVGAFIHPLSWDGGGDRAKHRSGEVILGSPLEVADSVEVRAQRRTGENVLKIITVTPTLLKKNSLSTLL